MSRGLLIGSIILLAIGLLMLVYSYYVGITANEKYTDLNCSKLNIFNNRGECDDQIIGMAVSASILFVGGIFTLVGFIASIVFGIKLFIDTRKKR
jgi:hypothetical protein